MVEVFKIVGIVLGVGVGIRALPLWEVGGNHDGEFVAAEGLGHDTEVVGGA